MMECTPASCRVIRQALPKFSCRSCWTTTQAPALHLPVRCVPAGPGLMAPVPVANSCDHLPLSLQPEINPRERVRPERPILSNRVGQAMALLRPLVDLPERDGLAGGRLHADTTPVRVLAPASGGTSKGRLWPYLRGVLGRIAGRLVDRTAELLSRNNG